MFTQVRVEQPSAVAVLVFFTTKYAPELERLLKNQGTLRCLPGRYFFDGASNALQCDALAPTDSRPQLRNPDTAVFVVPDGTELILVSTESASAWLGVQLSQDLLELFGSGKSIAAPSMIYHSLTSLFTQLSHLSSSTAARTY